MKTPSVEEELRDEHQADEARERLIQTIEEIRRRGHVAGETIVANGHGRLLWIAVGGAAAFAAGFALSIPTIRRRMVHMRRRRMLRRMRRFFRTLVR